MHEKNTINQHISKVHRYAYISRWTGFASKSSHSVFIDNFIQLAKIMDSAA